jgi:SAM-dependent methyltransferase
MNDKKTATGHNREAWDKVALADEKWFHACTAAEVNAARRGELKIKLTPTQNLPAEWLQGLTHKRVLCLAGGGGQQAPLLAAAGAIVTVFDLSEKQLARDRSVAVREGLSLETMVGDMRNLSPLADESFELIINPTAVCYCPETLPIWRECFRVLAPGGELIAGMLNPIHYLFDARQRDKNKLVVRHKIPYSDLDLDEEERLDLIGTERPIEFGHSISDLIGGQIAAGFALTGFFEDRWGDRDKLSDLIPVFFCTRARKLALPLFDFESP